MLLGLDPATRTGWAVVDDASSDPYLQCGSWQLPRRVEIAAKCNILSDIMTDFFPRHNINYAVVELPMSMPPRRKARAVQTALGFEIEEGSQGSIGTQNQLWGLHGCIIGALRRQGIGYRCVAASTWRAAMLGKFARGQAKNLSRSTLEAQGIHVPNADAAEAGMMVNWLLHHVKRFRLEDEIIAREEKARGG